MKSFTPLASRVIAATTTSQVFGLNNLDALHRGPHLYVANPSAETIFVTLGKANAVATPTNSMAIMPSAYFVLNVSDNAYLAVVATGNANLYITSGHGA